MYQNTTGGNNTAIGDDALRNTQTASQNTVIGKHAGTKQSSGINNVYVGFRTGCDNTNRSCNTFIGTYAGCEYTGGETTAIGAAALAGDVSGRCNTALGIRAGCNLEGNSCNNVYIGAKSGPSTGTVQCNQLYIGNNAGEAPLIRGDFSAKCVIIYSCLKVAQVSGSFVGDGSGLTGLSGAGFPYQGAAEITGSLIVSQSSAAGTVVTVENGHTILTQVSESLNAHDDFQASVLGVPLGGLYRNGNFIQIRIN